MSRRPLIAAPCAAIVLFSASTLAQPLPSWNESPAKAGIVAFVKSVTDKASKNYVPPPGSTVVDMKRDWKQIFPSR